MIPLVLENTVDHPIGMGSALLAIGQNLGGHELDFPRDQRPVEPAHFDLGRSPSPTEDLVSTATVIPDNERGLHESQAAADLSKALAWSAQNPASDAQTDVLLSSGLSSASPSE